MDPRSDLFSLGCVLYHAATGVMPFAGPDPLAVMTAVRTTTPPPAAAVLRSVPAGLSGLIARLMARDPADRPASAAAVAAELRALAAARPGRRLTRRLVAAAVAVTLLAGAVAALPWLDPRTEARRDAANRATALALRHGGAVRLPDGRLRRGFHEMPPPPHSPTEIVLRGVPRRDWPELLRCLEHTLTLCRLEVADCPLTDPELAALAYAPVGGRLEELTVTGCPQVTPHGLAAVARLANLRRLTLDAAGPSADAAVRLLGAALPGCRIEWPGGAVGPAAD